MHGPDRWNFKVYIKKIMEEAERGCVRTVCRGSLDKPSVLHSTSFVG